MDDRLRSKERDYYRAHERAHYYDQRTACGRSVERQRTAARTVGRYLSEGHVLDIGCGSARMIIEMARILPSLRFTGIDVSAEMVRLGQQNIREAGLGDRLEVEAVSAEGLARFPDGSFDMVMSHGSLSGWLDPKASLREVRRILKPSGYVFIRDWCRSAPREDLAPYLEQAAGNPEHVQRVEMAYASSYAEDELRALLLVEGLEPLEFQRTGLWVSAVLRKRPTR